MSAPVLEESVTRVRRAPRRGPRLSIVVPTFNERDNVRELVAELTRALAGLEWEVIFVDDDSPDGTSQTVRALAREDARVRCVQRLGRRGLASACVEGMLASTAPYVAVMDGDLQHDASILPQMLACLERGDAELVVGSRYLSGGGVGGWSQRRRLMSRLATRLSRAVVPATLTDPMSGFFALRRPLLDEVVRRLSGIGFKVLLDIVASGERAPRIREIPYVFRPRAAGESKLDQLVAWEYTMLLADKLVGRYVPVRFVSFALIGATGVGVHFGILALTYVLLGLRFVASQALAVSGSMVFNYTINNLLTYRDRRRTGWGWLRGLVSFVAACSIGAVANVGVAAFLFGERTEWAIAAVAGVLVGAVWNYAVTSVYTWGRKSG